MNTVQGNIFTIIYKIYIFVLTDKNRCLFCFLLTPEGLLQVVQSGKMLGEMRPGTAFGELAILYNCKRTATVKGE